MITLQIIASILVAIGLILNTNKNRLCWPIWIIGNIFLISLYFISKLYIIVGLQVLFIFINTMGWFKWSKERGLNGKHN